MIFQIFFAFSSCLKVDDLTITLGWFNTQSNPLTSKVLPFFNTSSLFVKTSSSFLENSLILQFSNDTNPSFINFSTVAITEEIYNLSNPLLVDDGFFRIGVNGYKKRAKILDPSTHERYIFNQFRITISENFSKKDPLFLVKEMDSVRFEVGRNISFSFKLYISKFDNPPPEPDYLSTVIFACAILTLFLVVFFFFYFKSKGLSITIIHLSDLWRVDIFFQNTILFSSIGITYIISIVVLLAFFYTNFPKDFFCFTNISLLANIVSVFLFGWTAVFMSRSFWVPEHLAIQLSFNSFVNVPFAVASIFNRYVFNSFVGFSIIKTVFLTVSSFLLSTLSSFPAFKFSQLYFQTKLAIRPKEINHKFELVDFIPSCKTILKFTFIGISFFFILRPVIDHCFLFFIDDYNFDSFFVLSFILLYVSIISLLSITNSYLNINKFTNSWQTNHITMNAIICLLFSVYLLVDILVIRNYLFKFETLVFCAAFLCCVIPALMFIGMAPSFYTNFLFFGFIFNSNDKVADNESGNQK